MRARAVGIAAALTGFFAIASCVGGDPDTSDPADASAGDGAAPEASLEGGNDAGGDDAAPDAPVGCSAFPGAAFCADFDDGGIDAGWSSVFINGGGVVDLDTSTSISPPGAMRSFVPPAVSVAAFLQKALAVSPATTKMHVEFDYQVDRFEPSAVTQQLFRVYRNYDYKPSIELLSFGAGVRIQFANAVLSDGGPSSGDSPFLALPTGRWAHLSLDVVFSTPGSIVMHVDGVTQVDMQGLALTGADATATMHLWVGTSAVSGPGLAQSVTTRFDNVVVDFPP